MGTAKPRWRDFGDLPTDSCTSRGQTEYLSAIIDRAIEHVGTERERWRDILDSISHFNDAQVTKVAEVLKEIAAGPANAGDKEALWEEMHEFIREHRTYQGAVWTMSMAELDRFEDVLPILGPIAPLRRHQWLFDSISPRLQNEDKNDQAPDRVDQLRQEAIRDILDAAGMEGLVELANACELPGFVAEIAVPLLGDISKIRSLIEHAMSAGQSGQSFIAQISRKALEIHGDNWRSFALSEELSVTWAQDIVVSLFLCWPDDMSTWEAIRTAGNGVEAAYWRRKLAFRLDGDSDSQTYQIDQLIAANRAATALVAVQHSQAELPFDVLSQLLNATLVQCNEAGSVAEFKRLGISPLEIREFLDRMRECHGATNDQIARCEYQALPILGPFYARGLTIQSQMTEDPDLFVQMLCDAFRPANRNNEEDAEVTLEEQARGRSAFALLNGLDQVPGRNVNEEYDEALLKRWVTSVRKRAAEEDRAEVADLYIGEILAHAPSDTEDGAWPHRVVRQVMESFESQEINRGMIIGRRNLRGVFTKDPYEGGHQERVLAGQYREWAVASLPGWPSMAALLDQIAATWDEDAEREDVRAEQAKLELDQ